MATHKKPRPLLSLAPFQKKNEDLIFQRRNIITMLKYMYRDEKSYSINNIFHDLIDKNTINTIKYYKLFIINDRPILYVKSITVNRVEIHINLSFYRSSGISRGDESIKNYWFPTTHIRIDYDKKYILAKLEDNYLEKYENMPILTDPSRNREEEEGILNYGRYITMNNALVGYFLFTNNDVFPNSSFEEINLEQLSNYTNYIPYTDFIREPELTLTSEKTTGGKRKKKIKKTKKTFKKRKVKGYRKRTYKKR